MIYIFKMVFPIYNSMSYFNIWKIKQLISLNTEKMCLFSSKFFFLKGQISSTFSQIIKNDRKE